MDILKQLNDAIVYVEAHLCEDSLDMNRLTHITGVTKDSFLRFFSYMTGMSLREYIRRRRLTLAAYELRSTDIKVIDAAFKYGYRSADAFAKAFKGQHGFAPTKARDLSRPLKVYPPASFHIIIKGAKEMEVRFIETEQISLYGLSRQFTGCAAVRFEQERDMWLENGNYLEKIGSENYGIWYGIWDNGQYWIAKAESRAKCSITKPYQIPAGTYAVFTTGRGGFAGDELPTLRELIFDAWLPDSGYEQAGDYEVEVYHLFPKKEKSKRYYEIWIPVRKK